MLDDQQAEAYYFVTNQSVDATEQIKICKFLKELGASKPKVYGKEYLTETILQSQKLRALVPRVYGLGDLSLIIDERCNAQTQAILKHLHSSLKTYVTTKAHELACKSINQFGAVLLIGSPGAGKSTLAACLSSIACEKYQCLKINITEFKKYWNPNEPHTVFWIDDAFGANQLEYQKIDRWKELQIELQSALALGSKFILTSRTHIWSEAQKNMGTKIVPFLQGDRNVVNVNELSLDEKHQIIYNHIKFGNQTKYWKSSVKGYLSDLDLEYKFFPELARRLGNQSFTKKIKLIPDDIENFLSSPEQFMIDTIEELSLHEKGALLMVFLFQSKLPNYFLPKLIHDVIRESYDLSPANLFETLQKLNHEFVHCLTDNAGIKFWSFFHPTLYDAVAAFIQKNPALTEVYLRGAQLQHILKHTTCEECFHPDKLLIHSSLDDLLIKRVLDFDYVDPHQEVNNEINDLRFNFLAHHANKNVLKSLIELAPQLFKCNDLYFQNKVFANCPETQLYIRLYRLNLLHDYMLTLFKFSILKSVKSELDLSFFKNNFFTEIFCTDRDDIIDAIVRAYSCITLDLVLLGCFPEVGIEPYVTQEMLEEALNNALSIGGFFDRCMSFAHNLRYLVPYFPDETLLIIKSKIFERVSPFVNARIFEIEKHTDENNLIFWNCISEYIPGERCIFDDLDD